MSDSISLSVLVMVIRGGIAGSSKEPGLSAIKSRSNRLVEGSLRQWGGGEPACIIGGEGVCTVRMGITTLLEGGAILGTKSSSGKQIAGIWREVGGLLLSLLPEGTSKVLGEATVRILGVEDDGEFTGLGLSTSIRIASSSSTRSLLLLRRGGRRGVGAGEGMGVGTSLMGDRHFPYSIVGISRRIVGGC